MTAEACSTTEDGDEPLHCPTGYECHIINPGNTAEGIPNRGHSKAPGSSLLDLDLIGSDIQLQKHIPDHLGGTVQKQKPQKGLGKVFSSETLECETQTLK
ncbi:hypothetical protein EK904_013362 [Melospiza melodia maxima]|nr:hypothetical protein EK904_013362 [Melospiza melodia maxima]